MRDREIVGLWESYLEVYAPQENIEEGLRSAVKRLLGGGKKEAEAPKPESRGAQLRKKYNVGPEKSDTSAKRQILDRSRARSEKDEKDYGDKPFQKQVANQSKAAHDKYLKAGYSKYGADDARGRGSKAAKRAAALNKEEFEIIVNALIEESYDLYNVILSHLLDEGYADTNENALAIMANMSEEWKEEILDESAANQSDKQIDRGVKTTYKAQNVLDNLHQGRSRGVARVNYADRGAKVKRMRGRLKARRDDLFGERNRREDESRAEMKKKYGL